MYESWFMVMVHAMFTCLSCFGEIRTEVINDLSYGKTRKNQTNKSLLVFIDERFNVISFFYSYFSFCLCHNDIFLNINIIIGYLDQFNLFYNCTNWKKFNKYWNSSKYYWMGNMENLWKYDFNYKWFKIFRLIEFFSNH